MSDATNKNFEKLANIFEKRSFDLARPRCDGWDVRLVFRRFPVFVPVPFLSPRDAEKKAGEGKRASSTCTRGRAKDVMLGACRGNVIKHSRYINISA